MLVPETLDLRHNARLAIGHMVANHDAQTGYPYFYINVTAPQPVASHNAWDLVDVTSRYVDSLILAREMTGDTAGTVVEEGYRRLLLQSLNVDDGLAYRAATPWSLSEAEMFDQSRALNALVTWYAKDRDPEVRAHADRLVEGLWRVAVHVAKRRAGYAYCYFPHTARFGDAWNPATPPEPCCYSGGSLILPLVEWADVTGSERALELGRRFVHFSVDETRIFRRDGSFWPDEMHLAAGHFHTRSLTMAGVLRYALLDGDEELVEWVRRAFDWAMTVSGSFGWFAEGIGTEDWYTTKHSETCSITDMLHVALKLAEAGKGAYWDHAERFVRNHLIESQWTRPDWLRDPAGGIPPDDPISTRRDMHARIMGGYAGRTRPNEFVADGVMMGCCCGAGPRALFLAWDHILQRKPEGLYVNLHLNRFSREATVLSWLPHAGRVEVRMQSEGPLFLRPPSCVSDGVLTLHVGEARRPVVRRGAHLQVDDVRPGDVVRLDFPVQTDERQEQLLDWSLKLRWRGDTVVGMEPAGSQLPLYQRGAMDSADAPTQDAAEDPRDAALPL